MYVYYNHICVYLYTGYMGVSTMGDGYKAAAADPKEMGKVRILQELKNVPEVEGYYADLPAQDGIGCCCQHIVHDPKERKVYFYSRIVGAGQFCMTREQYADYVKNFRKQKKRGQQHGLQVKKAAAVASGPKGSLFGTVKIVKR